MLACLAELLVESPELFAELDEAGLAVGDVFAKRAAVAGAADRAHVGQLARRAM